MKPHLHVVGDELPPLNTWRHGRDRRAERLYRSVELGGLMNAVAEQYLLGTLMVCNKAIFDIPDLRSEHFGNALHARIFDAIRKIINRGHDANPITLKTIFDNDPALGDVGGAQYLARCATAIASLEPNVRQYADTIIDLARKRDIRHAVDDVLEELRSPDPDVSATTIRAKFIRLTEGAASSLLVCATAEPHLISDIPPRRWAYGRFLIFGEPSALGAVDGGGKGAQAVVIGLSIVTGKSLLTEQIWRTGPVAIITYEDDEIEWHRRVAAACLHYGIDYQSVIGSFYFICRPDRRITLASRGPDKTISLPDGDDIIRELKRIGAALLIVDPFNHAHDIDDGNNNVMIAKVAGEVGRIAEQSGAAALVLHHLRKGSSGGPDDLMGATSLRATFRSCRILARMTTKEATALQVPPRQAWRYSRISGSKENYAPPPESARWYRLESVLLGNPDELYIEGDEVQVTTTWTPPSAVEGVSLFEIAEIFGKLRVGPGKGLRWSPDRRATEWIGKPIIEITGIEDEAATRITGVWMQNGVLTEGHYKHPTSRQERKFVTLNEAKAAEILGPLYVEPEP